MKLTKKEFKAADALFTQWRSEGVPTIITLHEAFNLTSELIGVPYQNKKQAEAISLSAVAVKTVKKIQQIQKGA